jgi:hypothetical protein
VTPERHNCDTFGRYVAAPTICQKPYTTYVLRYDEGCYETSACKKNGIGFITAGQVFLLRNMTQRPRRASAALIKR